VVVTDRRMRRARIRRAIEGMTVAKPRLASMLACSGLRRSGSDGRVCRELAMAAVIDAARSRRLDQLRLADRGRSRRLNGGVSVAGLIAGLTVARLTVVRLTAAAAAHDIADRRRRTVISPRNTGQGFPCFVSGHNRWPV